MSSSSPNQLPASGSTAVRLLLAASEFLGGDVVLARRLGIQPTLLARFMSGQKDLPAELLLRTVDIVLAVRDPGEPVMDESSRTTGTPGA